MCVEINEKSEKTEVLPESLNRIWFSLLSVRSHAQITRFNDLQTENAVRRPYHRRIRFNQLPAHQLVSMPVSQLR